MDAASIEIDITEEDIKQGKVCSTEECVVAITLARQGLKLVEVMRDRAYVGNVSYWFDEDLRNYIQDFDLRKNISPAKFIAYHHDNRNDSPKVGRPKKEKTI